MPSPTCSWTSGGGGARLGVALIQARAGVATIGWDGGVQQVVRDEGSNRVVRWFVCCSPHVSSSKNSRREAQPTTDAFGNPDSFCESPLSATTAKKKPSPSGVGEKARRTQAAATSVLRGAKSTNQYAGMEMHEGGVYFVARNTVVRSARSSHGATDTGLDHQPTFADDLADTVADDLHGDVAALRPPEVELAVDVVPEDGRYGALRRRPIARAEGWGGGR